MSRNSGGTYSLPVGYPIAGNTIISSTLQNDTMSDMRAEITDSLCRSGKGAMLAALPVYAGTVSVPGLNFDGDADTGFYRIGANNPGLAVGGVLAQSWSSTGSTITTGLVVTQSNADTAGATVTGNGSGAGLVATGGATGGGVSGSGGATSGTGVVGVGGAIGTGVAGIGGATTGTGAGVTGTGGATSGVGGVFSAAGGNSAGATGAGNGTGSGLEGTAGAGAGAFGVLGATSNAANAAGVVGRSSHAGSQGVFAQKLAGTGANEAALYADSTAGGYAAVFSGDGSTPVRAAVRIVPQDTDPSSPQTGDLYVNSGTGKLMIYNGGAWVVVGTQS